MSEEIDGVRILEPEEPVKQPGIILPDFGTGEESVDRETVHALVVSWQTPDGRCFEAVEYDKSALRLLAGLRNEGWGKWIAENLTRQLQKEGVV